MKMSNWEVGQELVSMSDFLAEKSADIIKARPQFENDLLRARAIIGDVFNQCNDHGFGIFDSKSLAFVIDQQILTSNTGGESES